MFVRIAAFELRHQLRRPILWGSALALFLAAAAFAANEAIRLDPGGILHKNAPLALAQVAAFFSIAYLFAVAAAMADACLRDDDSGFGPIIWSTPVTRTSYLLGRFAGATAAVMVAFAAMPLGLWVGIAAPWLDPVLLGPQRPGAYLSALAVFGLPNIVIGAALFFAVATATRSARATWAAVVAVLALYTTAAIALPDGAGFATVRALLDPLGVEALWTATRYWTPVEQNARAIGPAGLLLVNRLLWLALTAGLLALGAARYRWGAAIVRERRIVAGAEPAAVGRPGPLPRPDVDRAAATQFVATFRFEVAAVFRGPAIYLLLAIGTLQCFAALWNIRTAYGTEIYPVTWTMIQLLELSFAVVPVLVAVMVAGEAVWRDRERRVADLIDAAPVPGWVPVLAKTGAVVAVMLATLLASVAAAVLVQLLKGGAPIEPGEYLAWYVLPRAADLALVAVLAVAVQVVSPHKFVGWAIMLLWFGWTLAAPSLGFGHHLWRYGAVPAVPLSDMNGAAEFAAAAWWYRSVWAGCAVLMLLGAHLLWRRGASARLGTRLRRLRPSRPVIATAVAAMATVLLAGGWVVYNTVILNTYRDTDSEERDAADLERRYLRYERLPQPTITGLTLAVDLYPRSKRADARGRLTLTNRTRVPVTQLHLLMADRDTQVVALSVPGARLGTIDPRHGYRIYRLDRPMRPGERRIVAFATRRWQRGFRDTAPDTAVVRNGSFLTSFAIVPFVGMNRAALLQDRAARRRQGLPAALGLTPLADPIVAERARGGLGWAQTDVTIATDADQIPAAPGRRIADAVRGGRRIARFVSEAPTIPALAIQSAHYAVRGVRDGGVALAVYHHPAHGRNVDHMLRVMRASLAYFRASFGPYPRSHARIVEFPDYEQTARAFAGTIAYSEGLGFVSDRRRAGGIDDIAFVTAHELAHQYWGHQVLGGDGEGETLLSEAMAEYSALMALRRMYGEAGLRPYIAFERDRYFAGRAADPAGEVPLIRVGNQPYLHYAKGALALYQVQDRIGELAMNAAIRTYLSRYRFRSPPFPRSTDLVAALKQAAPDRGSRRLIADLFERIALYDLRLNAARARPRADGRWDVTIRLTAAKRYADGQGRERAAPLDEPVEVRLSRSGGAVLGRTIRVRSGAQIMRFVADTRPDLVEIDPRRLFLDRDAEDNVRVIA